MAIKKKQFKILVLFEVNDPRSPDEVYERYMKTEEDWFTEGHVVATLRENGHDVHLGAIYQHPGEVIEHVERVRPDLVWNFVESFRGHRYFESHIAAMLELLEVPFTGCSSTGERAITLSTSLVAVCCSVASASSRSRVSSFAVTL